MKGIGHFLSGLGVASCFPGAVEAAGAQDPFLILLGGVSGLLPDTIDFRICRYLWRADHSVCPGVDELDPKPVAETVAGAIDEARREQKMTTVKLHTMKVSPNYWRTYSVFIDPSEKTVTSKIGPLRTIGQVMGGSGSLPESEPKEGGVARARFEADVVQSYDAETRAEIFSGPDFAFVPERGRVRVDFIPWHRIWSHSLTFGVLWGLAVMLLLGLWRWIVPGEAHGFLGGMSVTAGLIAVLGFWSHVLVDQSGKLGCNLLYPFTKKRTNGLGVTASGSVFGNFTLNYVSIAVILWNLNAFAPEPAFRMHWAASMQGDFSTAGYYLVSLANYTLYAVAGPLGALYLAGRILRRWRPDRDRDDPGRSAVDAAGEFGTL
jgi:membrane-bound metal-dependent hydrolase YbcI (DUF457 family)